MNSATRLQWPITITLTVLLSIIIFWTASAQPRPQEQATEAHSAPSVDTTSAQFPRYHIYTPPSTLGQSAGEPTLGVNHITNATMYIAVLETLRIHFDDDYSQALIADPEVDHRICSSPVKEVWLDKSYDLHVQTLDPILFTDPLTGRTFSSQLIPKTSILGISDDDGETWLPSEGAAAGTSGLDHQTIASGPYPPTFPIQGIGYPHAVYYCGQDIAYANCARSDDGGTIFGLAIPTYTIAQCGGLHGHLQVEPLYTDENGVEQGGTVYLPNKSCGGNAAVIVSEDAGTTWTVRHIPDSVGPAGLNDPSVGIGAKGTLYVGYGDSDETPMVAVSRDRGATWDSIQNVAANISPPLQTVVFPAMIAGDDDRAAMAFFGTTHPNAIQLNDEAEWYLYVSHTFDGGETWNAINVTPNDPIQRGSICTGGTACTTGDRNLLDFFDAKVDREGRVIVGFDDGCIGDCVIAPPNSFSARAAIARQEGGLRLYAAFDEGAPEAATVPAAPRVDVVEQDAVHTVTVAWTLADDGGSPVLGYNVYRKIGAEGTFELQNQDGLVSEDRYVDDMTEPETDYIYKVTAVNAIGEGASCLEFGIGGIGEGPVGTPCVFPGVQVTTDATGDTTSLVRPDTDITAISIAEPYDEQNPQENFVFTLKIADLTTASPTTTYYTLFNFDGQGYYVSASQISLAGTGSYDYGTFTYNSNDNFLTTTSLGTPDDGGYDGNGSISITLAKDKINFTGKIPKAGDVLSKVDARVIALVTPAISTLFEDRPGAVGTYTVVSNAACAPNEAPTARLSVTPTEGQSPLDVSIDASASFDTDEGDTIAEYHFDLDEGDAPIIQSSPILTHTYVHTESEKIEYRISVSVVDSRGLPSDNIDAQVIEVLPEDGVPTALTTGQISVASSRAGIGIGVAVIVLMLMGVAGTVMRSRRES